MATQSLYRRYRPRRFGELKGQEHIVRALRNAVANDRGGQAYLFSGPRGTGKTSAARILAKVLNCANPQQGEPCCECESCLAIDRGTSFDVLELDAASNNGVDNIRELIERAAMGNPGRHRVFILDEVHMLSTGAEAALLKTLEEPPPHVVFVLATTDPQKVSETIRSRTQHLQFRLLPAKELEAHVRWVVSDAGLTVSDDAISQVIADGGGSARDTLSALELVAAGGGEADSSVRPEDVIEALIARDAAEVLTKVAAVMQRGYDPKTFTEQIVRYLREMFLSSMSPQLVQLSQEQAVHAAELTARYGIASVVRAIETLGEALLDIRRAPDPRLVLEVTLVRLASNSIANDTASLVARVERLETGGARPRDVTGPIPRPRLTETVATPRTATSPTQMTTRAKSSPTPTSPTSSQPATTSPTSTTSSNTQVAGDLADLWPSVLRTLKATVRALYSAVDIVSASDDALVFSAPSDMHKKKCLEWKDPVVAALTTSAGRPISIDFVVHGSRGPATAETVRPSAAAPTPEVAVASESDEVDESRSADSFAEELSRQFPGSTVIDSPKG
ncbi:MAG: DNA polymerase III subunit gamma/tau [Actinobacteria bacterium]|nr:DNA polymerase III subunit gamma/tau [Actinomycetota bacterium]NDE67416.1 DNA polymerase III subunit gamma/tau [Actinomycetota bacterium]